VSWIGACGDRRTGFDAVVGAGRSPHRDILWAPVIGEGTMYYVLIAFLAVVVVAFTWIVLEAKVQFRRRSRAISQAATRPPKGRLTRP